MKTNIGEYVAGAYLQVVKDCDVVNYNVKNTDNGMKGMNEFDVLALNLTSFDAYLCEVSTHLNGFNYGKGNKNTIAKLNNKFINMQEYASKLQLKFNVHYMFWSPYVPKGYLTNEIEILETKGLEAIVNSKYKDCINELKEKAKVTTKDYNNPFYLSLQILSHLR
ncbi:hypothetical protein V7O61_06500 [Methanolobus sp. WCC1]|uniref:hypothetical protein n=1 Tax=unclassified Methanolobus TaxID=2629569 RepID=UPI003253FF59